MKFIDIHSHILQNIDDGATSVEMAIELLKESANQNVGTIVLTPHYYNSKKQTVDSFLLKRNKLFDVLKREMANHKFDFPNLRLGAEVALTCDLSKVQDIEKLAIEGTNYILIEMPYSNWQGWMFESIYSIIASKNLIPVIAHIERYPIKKNEYITELANMELYFQMNASSLMDIDYKADALKLIGRNLIHFIGSDAHNLEIRPPQIKEAMEFLGNKISPDFVGYLCENAELLLENKYIEKENTYRFKPQKDNIFKRLFKR